MRIIAGRYRGTVLESPEGFDTRPTKEMVREALFSSLGNIGGKRFLDLFAGSGAMGIEAMSRGAVSYFNDIDERANAVISHNLRKIKREDISPAQKDALSYLRETEDCFDIIFCDPPYACAQKEELLRVVEGRQLLKPGGSLIYEESVKEPLREMIGGFLLRKAKKYGISRICIYKKEEKE